MAPSKTQEEYERRRQDNIRRNEAIMASLRRKAADLSAAVAASRPRKQARPTAATPRIPVVLRRSLRTRGISPSAAPPLPPSPQPLPAKPLAERFALSEAFVGEPDTSPDLCSAILAASSAPSAALGGVGTGEFDAAAELVLRPGNVRRVVPEKIHSMRFLPLADRAVVVAGNSSGHLGFWDLDSPAGDDADGVFEYFPHRDPVFGISAHPASPRKIYSCSYGGEVCLMDVEKEIFNMIHLSDYRLMSLCQHPNNSSSLYFGEGEGQLKAFDERIGKVSATWVLHNQRINSVDFQLENACLLATGSSDGTACIWDLRKLENDKPQCLKVVKHRRAVHSAFFSPSGSSLATTSCDGTVGILSMRNLANFWFFNRSSQTGRWISSLNCSAIWGWNDSDMFIGNTKRGIDVIKADLGEGSVSVSRKGTLKSEHVTSIPYRLAIHPYMVGHLAGSSAGGKVFLWTRA